ncbi:SusC/RagA family TonB-linked outer membrane protein [Chitinophaga sp. XS-30]|uniref:SusC/RagA family TonB-linked outer membrane protein n=1 Tax=Chitinophaga sp. XS-30 TaxID=2604421 RepID=UPI0011DE3B23|nr:SusC/RagA family TonB-linked outer membrane protein [Chitinophaga sp. XS-30]QEH43603.1 SusC/RagA family TonB-linked outer membrane protein [Chitinophaga sp. XS-30]
MYRRLFLPTGRRSRMPATVPLVTKLTTVLLFFAIFQVHAVGFAQKITLSEKNAQLEDVFLAIRKLRIYDIVYDAALMKNARPVTIDVKNATLKEVLDKSFKDQPLTYTLRGNTIIIREKTESILPLVTVEKKKIRGRVTDASRKPLPGVTIRIKGTQTGTVTAADGSFSLDVEEKAVLQFSFIGYSTKEIAIGNATELTVVLDENNSTLNQVVVQAYGTAKVKDITGSVAHLGTKEIRNAPMGATIQSMLQGKVSGVNVAIQSASPTSPISVIIRGASSISGTNQPLWVIDGVPDYSTNTSGNITNSLYNLNLNDVESIDILKDASATALYGSRAANGVVIVTTRRGAEGMRPTIELSTRVGMQVQDFNRYKYMEAPEYIYFADKAARMEAYGRGAFDYFTRLYLDEQAFFNLNSSEYNVNSFQTLPGAFYEGNTNWMKEVTRNPFSQQYDLSLRGGTSNISYFVSLYNTKMDGIVKSGGSNLYGGRINLEAKLRNNLKFGLNMNGATRKADDKDYMLTVLKKVRPDIPPYNPDGSLFTRDAYTENPYTTLLNTRNGNGQTFNGTGFLELSILDGLLLRTAFTANYANSQSLTYMRRGSTFNTTGSRTWENPKMQTKVWENTLTYVKNVGKHDILALAGFSMEKYSRLRYEMNATNFPDDDILNDFTSGATRGALKEEYTANALVSQFARAHYKYNDRYIISGTIRRDGSSRFGPDQRWGLFPSGAIAWLISEEAFMKSPRVQKIVSYLKLRASTGTAGSQNLGNYDWITGVGSSRYNEQPAIAPSSIGNANLQWEQTRMTDLGLDYGLWDERIRGTIGMYRKHTDQLIYNLPLPPSSSFSSITSNVASLKNEGFEFDINVDVIKKNDLTFTLDFNASRNTNTILKINGITKELLFPNSYTPYMSVKENQRTGIWYGFQTANRLVLTAEEIIALQGRSATGGKTFYRNSLENAGDLLFIDQNGDGVITNDDKVSLGSADPKFFGGFGATLTFRNLMINTTFTYSYGNKRLWSMAMEDAGYVGNYNQSNLVAGKSATLLSPWEATMPRMTQYGDGGNSTFSDFWLHDASYVRLNALNASYRLPAKIFRDYLIQGVDITFQATNLFTLTRYPGFDPQGNWSSTAIGTGMGVDNSFYPSAKNFNLGARFTFK